MLTPRPTRKGKFTSIWTLCFVCFFLSPTNSTARDDDDYLAYHRAIIKVETAIADQAYNTALNQYRQVFAGYDFVFLRDYKIATQLALHTGRTDEAFAYLKQGIANGWELKAIRKNRFLKKLRQYGEWKTVERQYDSLRGNYRARINPTVRATVKKLFRKDQWKAMGGLFMFGPKAQDRYAERKFAPQSEKQLAYLDQIISTYGYPGERLIGNNFWTATILSHHNSMTVKRTRNDTLYPHLKPRLLQAIRTGQMSPPEFAIIDDWYITVGSDHAEKAYGYLSNSLTNAERGRADQLRNQIGLRSVSTRNRLLDIQQQTGMNFYLPPWPRPNGKIDA